MSTPEQVDRRFPIVTALLCAANVLWWGFMVARGVSPTSPTTEQLLHWGAIYAPSIVYDHEWWRLASAPFVHLAFWHVGLNMMALVVMGMWVERALGSARFAALYLAAALLGSIVSVDISPNRVSAGASGAIFGVFGAAYVLRRLAPDVVARWSQRAQRSINSAVVWLIVFTVVPGVDNAAHAGGAVAGVLLTYAFLRSHTVAVAGSLLIIAVGGVFLVRPRVLGVPAVVAWHAAHDAHDRLAANAPKEALAILDALPPAAQDERDALLQRCYAYDALEDFAHALECSTKLLAKTPDDATALTIRCHGRVGTKDYDGALADCAKAEASPTMTDALRPSVAWARLQIALQRRDWPTMRAQADVLISAAPERPEIYLLRGMAALNLDDVAGAAKDYERAASLGLTSEKLGGGPCTIASRLGRPDADAKCDAAVAAAPNGANACVARAQHYDLTSRYDRAIAEIDRCLPIATGVDVGVTWNNRAWYEMHAGKLDAATRDIARAVEADPKNLNTIGTRCFIEAKRGLVDAAREDCRRAAASGADNLYDRGMLHLLEDDPSSAVATWTQLIEKKPWSARELAPYLAQAKRAMAHGATR